MSGVSWRGRTCSAAGAGLGAELIGKAALSFCIAGDPLLSLRTSGARKTACFASQDGYNIRYWPCRKSFCRPNLHKHSEQDRKSTRLNSSHQIISYAVFCLKKKK